VFFRQLLNDESACASYLLGCKSRSQLAVVDPHIDLVDQYIALAEAQEVPIAAVFETHVQADHVSGLPDLVDRTGATPYLPEGAGVDFDHRPLADAEIVRLGNTEFKALATPGHAQAHHAYLVTDHARADDPWMVLTGDALLVGDAGRPDLHAHGDHSVEQMARSLYRSLTERLLSLPDEVQTMLAEGQISAGHARAIAASPDPAALARQVVERGLSVRETEALARRAPETKSAKPKGRTVRDADTAALENDLAEALGLEVELRHRGNAGELRVKYATLEQLDDLCRRLMR